jgi:hypothetical protein
MKDPIGICGGILLTQKREYALVSDVPYAHVDLGNNLAERTKARNKVLTP